MYRIAKKGFFHQKQAKNAFMDMNPKALINYIINYIIKKKLLGLSMGSATLNPAHTF